MTTAKRLREIAANCEDVSFVASESNAEELRRLADELERIENQVGHWCWVWNRRIIESIRASVPNAPVLDEDLVKVIAAKFSEVQL